MIGRSCGSHRVAVGTLSQLLDDGRLTDAQGRTVNFHNTVIIMTVTWTPPETT